MGQAHAEALYVGLMSGTSLDGIDAVLADCAGITPQLLAARHTPFPAGFRKRLQDIILSPCVDWDVLGQMDGALGDLFAASVNDLLREHPPARPVEAIGSHGLTVRHRPDVPQPFSLQIGDPNRIAQQTGIAVVADFRRRDLAAGGQGAPLAPAFHAAVFRDAQEDRAVLNLGGIANITLLPADVRQPVSGFDTGPGNGLLDAWTFRTLGAPYDAGGAWAASGRIVAPLLEHFLTDPYFAAPPPKSTGKEHFHPDWLDAALARFPGLDARDVQATLAELTAVSVARAILTAPATRRVLVCGGGAHNADLMNRIEAKMGGRVVESTENHGLHPDWVEALAFAWLAHRTMRGAPGNLPEVTGASAPVVLGGVYPG